MIDRKLQPSRITLGTVQLGLDYGVANRHGRPDAVTAKAILDRAWAAGITSFDTAAAYGDAEARLGAWLATGDRPALVISKFPRLASNDTPASAVRAAFEKSSVALSIGRPIAYLAHHGEDLQKPGVADVLRDLRGDGRISVFGASIYTPKQAFSALGVEGLDVIQLPFNAFNTDLLESGALTACAEAGVSVFARSVFVQGLLLIDPSKLPSRLSGARPYIDRFRAVAAAADISPIALALNVVLSRPEIASAVIGIDSPDQIDAVTEAAKHAVDLAILEEVASLAGGAPSHLFDPSQWPSR